MQPSNLDSSQAKLNQWIKFIGFSTSILVVVLLLIFIVHRNNAVPIAQMNEKLKFETPLLHINDEAVILEKSQKRAADAERKASELELKMADMSQTQNKVAEEVQHRIEALERTLQEKQQDNAVVAALDPLANRQANGTMEDGQIIRRDKLDLHLASFSSRERESEGQRLPAKTPDTYVPAGTFIQGVIIEGADASASVTAQTNPEPMLIRLTSSGTLPNHRHSHLKGCTVTLAASGDISSERGKIRTERLSCVKPDGEIIDVPIEGNIAGPDGKNGLRGNPLWRETALLQRAFSAGALSGLSEGISQTYSTNSISSLGNVQTTDSGKILQVGIARGTSKAMDKLADYNIQRAEQYHPVIQLSAGAEVNVVILKGFYLDGRKHNENEEEAAVQSKSIQTPSFFPVPQQAQLPLSDEQVARLDERGKELGLQIKHTEN